MSPQPPTKKDSINSNSSPCVNSDWCNRFITDYSSKINPPRDEDPLDPLHSILCGLEWSRIAASLPGGTFATTVGQRGLATINAGFEALKLGIPGNLSAPGNDLKAVRGP